MGVTEEMGAFKKVFDKELARYFSSLIIKTKKEDAATGRALEHVRDITLAGGKRIRPMLTLKAYEAFGGKNKKAFKKVAVAIELVHVYLLIHDDICDRSATRHGKKTLHQVFVKKDSDETRHYGESMAIIVGDLLYAQAVKLIAESGLEVTITNKIISFMQDVVTRTVVGQVQDLAIQNSGKARKRNIMDMYINKTARYTFEGPLHMGMIAAGCNDEKTYVASSAYSRAIGIAFQMQDDMLGIFGNGQKTGKSTISDIQEGKQTMLVAEARLRISKDSRKKIDSLLGKADLTKDEAEEFRAIVKNSGALEAIKKEVDSYLEEAVRQAGFLMASDKLKEFLSDLAGYLAGREV